MRPVPPFAIESLPHAGDGIDQNIMVRRIQAGLPIKGSRPVLYVLRRTGRW
jgi:hypothetical protein